MSFSSNYAIGGSNFNPAPFRDAVRNLSDVSRWTFDESPPAGYEHWLTSLRGQGLSNSQDRALRMVFDTLRSRFDRDIALGGADRSGMRWSDWLATLDPNLELARLPMQVRGQPDAYSRFARPGRMMGF